MYRSAGVSQYSQLTTKAFCCSKVLLCMCHCWWQLAYLD